MEVSYRYEAYNVDYKGELWSEQRDEVCEWTMRTTNVTCEGGVLYRWIMKVNYMEVSCVCGVIYRIELCSYGSKIQLWNYGSYERRVWRWTGSQWTIVVTYGSEPWSWVMGAIDMRYRVDYRSELWNEQDEWSMRVNYENYECNLELWERSIFIQGKWRIHTRKRGVLIHGERSVCVERVTVLSCI